MTRPYFASERLLGVLPGQPPYLGCRVSSIWHGYALATDNESAYKANARPKNKAAITADLLRGWKAFATQKPADNNGIPDQGDVDIIARAMFPALPLPDTFNTRDWADVIAKLGSGKAVSIALRLRAVPASSRLRRWTSADHQTVIWAPNKGTVMSLDPMHPPSATWAGWRVPLAEVEQAAAAIDGGLFITSLFPLGKWTAANLKTRDLRARIAQTDVALTAMTEHRDRIRTQRNLAQQALEDCEARTDDCAEQLAAQREAIADRLAEFAEDVRNDEAA